jgi:hypothetical protein
MAGGPSAEDRGEATHQAAASGTIALPRWLQRSTQRQGSIDGASVGVRPPLVFETEPRPGRERRTIGYRFVRVADRPDDAESLELCRLDRGDEVEITGEHEGYLRILTPDGVEGWVQRVVIVG